MLVLHARYTNRESWLARDLEGGSSLAMLLTTVLTIEKKPLTKRMSPP